jgi:hypothetical protein
LVEEDEEEAEAEGYSALRERPGSHSSAPAEGEDRPELENTDPSDGILLLSRLSRISRSRRSTCEERPEKGRWKVEGKI